MGSTLFSKRYRPYSGRHRKRRPKKFDTEEKAKKYAEEKGLKDAAVEKLTYSDKFIIKRSS